MTTVICHHKSPQLDFCQLILPPDWLEAMWVDQQQRPICFLPHLPRSTMRFTVVPVAMAMLCVMAIHADVKPQKDFNLQKFTGKWYRVGLAYDSPGFAPYRDKLKATMGIITQTPDGHANLTMWELSPLGCQSLTYQYNKTSVPGEFIYFSTRHNIEKDITVVDTDYTDYALVLKYKVFNREYTQVALYGRTPRVRNNILQKFKALALSQGLSKESILIPPLAENCPITEPGE